MKIIEDKHNISNQQAATNFKLSRAYFLQKTQKAIIPIISKRKTKLIQTTRETVTSLEAVSQGHT